jgi:hypothetical protein
MAAKLPAQVTDTDQSVKAPVFYSGVPNSHLGWDIGFPEGGLS